MNPFARINPPPVAQSVPSPCNSICRMDEATGCCQGCARTLPEIAAWAGLDEADKRRVWALLPERRRVLGARYLGPVQGVA
jgi:predicted Fe-S protein YdhL (DUF1289 family)